jgi:hypothetical protein
MDGRLEFEVGEKGLVGTVASSHAAAAVCCCLLLLLLRSYIEW